MIQYYRKINDIITLACVQNGLEEVKQSFIVIEESANRDILKDPGHQLSF
jgi:hypothetical protein